MRLERPSTDRLPTDPVRQRCRSASVSMALVAALVLGLGFGAAQPVSGQLMVPVGDVAKLVRKLLEARRDGIDTSKRIRLEDGASGRTAVLQIADDGSGTLALLITFAVTGEPLHVHTVSVTLDGNDSLYLDLFRIPPESRKQREIVGAQLEPGDLELLAEATSVEITARGWDETFVARLGPKDLEKIQRFHRSRRRVSETREDGDALPLAEATRGARLRQEP